MNGRWHRRAIFGCFLIIGCVGVAGAAGAATAGPPVHHKVLRGQTLYSIARSYGVPVRRLAAANGIVSPTSLRAGARLVIPGRPRSAPEPHIGRAAQDLPPPLTPVMSPRIPDSLPLPARLPWPIDGRVISSFDRPRGGHRHQGIDIGSDPGAPIRAVANGVVALSEEHYGSYGRLVAIEHDNGMVSYYGHNMKNLVKPGQRVSAQEVIALVGHSGNASCDHVHFEIRLRGEAIDPMTALKPQP